MIPEDKNDDWDKLSNKNNKISSINDYLIPKDSRRRRGNKGGLLNLSKPESLKTIDNVKTEPMINLVQPLVSYYDSFPGIKNYETEQESLSDIILTEKRSQSKMETIPIQGYLYEKKKRESRIN